VEAVEDVLPLRDRDEDETTDDRRPHDRLLGAIR